MSRKKELQRQLGGRYSYERLLSDREIQRIGKRIPADFSETAAAVLTAGCLRLNAVLYHTRQLSAHYRRWVCAFKRNGRHHFKGAWYEDSYDRFGIKK